MASMTGAPLVVVAEEGAGGAGVQAVPAGAAVVLGEGRGGLQREVGEKDAQKEVRAPARVDEHGVPAEPAEAGSDGEFPFQERSRVDVGAAPEGASREVFEAVGEGVQLFGDDEVVVATAGVAGDDGAGGVGWWGSRLVVGVGVGDDECGLEAGEGVVEVGAASYRVCAGQVVHAAVEARFNPSPKVGHVLAVAPRDHAGHLEAEGAGFGEGPAGVDRRIVRLATAIGGAWLLPSRQRAAPGHSWNREGRSGVVEP